MIDTVFLICNAAVMPFWLLLMVLPRARVTSMLVHGPVVPLLLGLVYVGGFLSMGPPPEGAGFGTLAGVMKFFSMPQGVLVGWVHYLIFDLFVGAWEARDAQRLGIPHLLLLPCLFFTLMLGPIGLLLYLGLRLAMRRRLGLAEG